MLIRRDPAKQEPGSCDYATLESEPSFARNSLEVRDMLGRKSNCIASDASGLGWLWWIMSSGNHNPHLRETHLRAEICLGANRIASQAMQVG